MQSNTLKYSTEFQKLISNPEQFAELMKDNESSPVYEEWEQKRRFIADVVDSDGTILDIGCAGGFFLRSLQEWSGHKLTPYGVDIDEGYIYAAQKLYPDLKDHFAVLDVREINTISTVGLPENYDFVYWNFLGLKYFKDSNLHETIKSIIALANKRVIVGFYRANSPKATETEQQEEKAQLKKRVDDFTKDWPVTGTLYNPTKFNQAIVWIDKE
ncbi:MAG: class I SAM-dependent methyltransferase [Candidatus Saccharibacteria bacterium]